MFPQYTGLSKSLLTIFNHQKTTNMKKLIGLIFMMVTYVAYTQQANLFTVHMVKPKNGQKMAFEAAYKTHVAKFHKTDKVTVYEVLSGPRTGYYHVVSGPSTFADLDKERADRQVHGVDLDRNFFAYLENEGQTIYARWYDTLSFHTDIQAEKFVVNVRHIKPSSQADRRKEQSRSIHILNKMKHPFFQNLSFNYLEHIWDGSDTRIVSFRKLKDGFKEFDPGYYPEAPAGTPTFKDEYIKAYGTLDWEKRQKLLDESEISRDQFIMKLRKDLSSQ
jgi:hypothetical protein